MKKLLLIVGIVSIIVCALFLIFALLNLFGCYHVMDGSAELFDRLHQRMIVSFAIGIILAVIGTVCIIIGSRV